MPAASPEEGGEVHGNTLLLLELAAKLVTLAAETVKYLSERHDSNCDYKESR